MRGATDQLEVTMNVPHLGQAIGFYETLLDAPPRASTRRAAWFDFPGTALSLALRESSASDRGSLRVCTDAARLRATSARLGRTRVKTIASGLASDGHPRSIALSDPGGNRLELCAPLAETPPIPRQQFDVSLLLRTTGRLLRRSLSAGPMDRRFDQARAQDQMLSLRRDRRI